MAKVRIVAAVPHNDTEELEVILEVTRSQSNFIDEIFLTSIWLDADKLLAMTEE